MIFPKYLSEAYSTRYYFRIDILIFPLSINVIDKFRAKIPHSLCHERMRDFKLLVTKFELAPHRDPLFFLRLRR